MPVSTCRVCGQKFFDKPLLIFENMPKSAQYLPGPDELDNDEGIDLEVCQCSGCGLVQLSNDPVPYYKEVIRSTAFSPEMEAFRKAQFREFCSLNSLGGKKILEVGCGNGEYLSLMKELDVQTFGLEYSNISVVNCINKGFNVERGFVDQTGQILKHAPFDAFYMMNFLEHLPSPNSTLRGIHNNLSDGAIGLIEVPNFDMNINNSLFTEFVSDHLFYFTRETLRSVLSINGFEVTTCEEVWHDHMLSAVIRKRKRLQTNGFELHQEQLTSEIRRYINELIEQNKKVAIWGAGHSSLTILALMNLSYSIEYVVDSAIFKQGKYTPVTHLRIVSPDVLVTEPVDAVVVMVGGYSGEVANGLLNRFGNKMQVAILKDSGLAILN